MDFSIDALLALRVVSWFFVVIWIYAFYSVVRWLAPTLPDRPFAQMLVVTCISLLIGNVLLAITLQRVSVLSNGDATQVTTLFFQRFAMGFPSIALIWSARRIWKRWAGKEVGHNG